MFVWPRGGRLRVFTRQKATRLFLFTPLVGALRVQRFHAADLLVRELRQPSDEVNEGPARPLSFRLTRSPRGPPREANAVLDDREKVALGEFLRCRGAHVRRRRVQPPADLGISTAVVRVTHGAMIREV